MLNKAKNIGLVIGISLSIFLISFIAFAWSSPPGAPPTCPAGEPGCETPLHTGTAGQSKTGGLLLNTGGAATGLIVENGNVGIGITNPGAKLDVDGNIWMYGSPIVESGSDENGRWIKFADGTMIQHGYLIANATTTTTYGSIYHGNLNTQILFPQSFIATPDIVTQARTSGVGGIRSITPSESGTTNISVWNGASVSGFTFNVYWIAVGRWK